MVLLSFKGTQDVGIRYRLLGGQGSEWEETREMEVHYRHLDPGDYRFEVAAADQAGNAGFASGSLLVPYLAALVAEPHPADFCRMLVLDHAGADAGADGSVR